MRLITAVLILLMAGLYSHGDSARLPEPRVFSSLDGHYYLRLVPSEDYDEKKTKGFLYRVSDGEDEPLYESNGWYSSNVLISYGGRYLARLGPFPSRFASPAETPAIVFYADGTEVKTYYVSDLVADLSKLSYSVSHYSWGGILKWTESNSGDDFAVNTVDGQMITFNIRTSQIIDWQSKQ